MEYWVETLKFMMYNSTAPHHTKPARNRVVDFPMPQEMFLQIFPDAMATNSKDRIKFDTLKQSRRLFSKKFENAAELDQTFGENWWRIHFKTHIGIIYGNIEFYLIEKKLNLVEWEVSQLKLVPESSRRLYLTQVRVRFLFTNINKAKYVVGRELVESKNWRQKSHTIMMKKEPWKLNIKRKSIFTNLGLESMRVDAELIKELRNMKTF